MKGLTIWAFLFLAFSPSLRSQLIGGRSTFAFLGLPASGRIAALGGSLISVADDDVNLGLGNPALLNPKMHRQLAFNHSFFTGGSQFGYAAYGHHLPNLAATFQLGVKYINHGEIEATDIFFQEQGIFKVKETAIVLGGAFALDERIQVGANVRFISSTLADLQSVGLAADIGMLYQDTSRKLAVGIVLTHLGTQLSTYSGNPDLREPLPFEMQLGLSKQLRYLPFRFSLVYRDLQRWNVLYDDPNQENGTLFIGDGDTSKEPGKFGRQVDNFFRHLVFSGELLLGARENFRLRAAYDHRLRKELTAQGFGSAAGFSFGAGVKISRFRLDYGRSNYHLAGGINHFSISTNLEEFRSRK
ncbi:MAG: type IX secretion system protein PorQ [Haliscomenobacter sp.]|nr:type IX secretion system protein PorQ [Haliscomenobacter sp.]